MFRPKIWQTVGYFAKRDAVVAFDKFKHLFKWQLDGKDSFIDVGCATGDLIVNIILPHLTKNFTKIVGVDVSKQMIEYAREYVEHPKISFEQMDISLDQQNKFTEQFDHLTSFCSLHWIAEEYQQIVFKNLYNFLKPNGNCLITVVGTNPAQVPYLTHMKNPKWAPYMQDAKQHVSSYHFMLNPAEQLRSYMEICGFKNIHIESLEDTWYPFRVEKLRELLIAIDPFLTRIPKEQHMEYIDELLDLAINLEPMKKLSNHDLVFAYKLFYAFGEK